MKVIITQNRDKELHIVNGQTATVHTMQNATVFLKLPNDHIVAVYPVTATVEHHIHLFQRMRLLFVKFKDKI